MELHLSRGSHLRQLDGLFLMLLLIRNEWSFLGFGNNMHHPACPGHAYARMYGSYKPQKVLLGPRKGFKPLS
jgi:hypothetical protein